MSLSLLEDSTIIKLLFVLLNGGLGYWLGLRYERVKNASVRDDLTETYNRRFLHETIPQILKRRGRRKAVVSVTLIDCDDFKQINDLHGHAVGDLVLKRISQLLLKNTRQCDYVVRWGGDEFLIIADFGDPEACRSIKRRVEQQLRVLSQQMNLPLSLSFGTAIYPMEASRIDDLIRIADHKMYESKYSKKEAAIS